MPIKNRDKKLRPVTSTNYNIYSVPIYPMRNKLQY